MRIIRIRDVATTLLLMVAIGLIIYTFDNIATIKYKVLMDEKTDSISYYDYKYSGEFAFYVDLGDENDVSDGPVMRRNLGNVEFVFDRIAALDITECNVIADIRINMSGRFDVADYVHLVMKQNEPLIVRSEAFDKPGVQNALVCGDKWKEYVDKKGIFKTYMGDFTCDGFLKSRYYTRSDNDIYMFYETLSDEVKDNIIQSVSCDTFEMGIEVLSNKKDVKEVLDKLRESLSEEGYRTGKRSRSSQDRSGFIESDKYDRTHTLLGVVLLIFSGLAMFIILQLFFYVRRRDYAIMWALGKNRLGCITAPLGEVTLIYLITMLIYMIINYSAISVRLFSYFGIAYLIVIVITCIKFIRFMLGCDLKSLLMGGVR